jgi:hypothetical protein
MRHINHDQWFDARWEPTDRPHSGLPEHLPTELPRVLQVEVESVN